MNHTKSLRAAAFEAVGLDYWNAWIQSHLRTHCGTLRVTTEFQALALAKHLVWEIGEAVRYDEDADAKKAMAAIQDQGLFMAVYADSKQHFIAIHEAEMEERAYKSGIRKQLNNA